MAKSYAPCLRDGLSQDMELRLFELSWRNGNVIGWVRDPIFWLTRPSTLTRKWLQIPESWRPTRGTREKSVLPQQLAATTWMYKR
jgi:hypothetical protein